MTLSLITTPEHTVLTLPHGAAWVVAILALGGLWLYVEGVRNWLRELRGRSDLLP